MRRNRWDDALKAATDLETSHILIRKKVKIKEGKRH